MKKRNILTVIPILAAALLLSCGAATERVPDAVTETEESTLRETAEDCVVVSSEGCGFVVMRSDSCGKEITNAALELKYAITDKFGTDAAPVLKTDWEKGIGRGDSVENDLPEILIGTTNRAESKEVIGSLPDEHYAIKWVGSKLVIAGTDERVTCEGVKAFIERFVKTADGDTLAIPRDTEILSHAPRQKIALADDAEMRVMTFNILGSGDGYDQGRRELIMETVLDYMPDVIGFQESNKTNLATLHQSPEFTAYYDINAKYHPKDTTANYTLILFLKDKYTLIEGGVEWNRCRYTGTNTKSTSWAVLERIEDGQRFIVTNIHGSLWDPYYELPEGETYESMETKANGVWHIDNAEQVMENVDELRETYGDLPVISVGDYNFNETHRAYFRITEEGYTDARAGAKEADRETASYHSNVGQSPSPGGRPIDHIFYTADSLEAVRHVICRRNTDINASDHCPVYADFRFIQ